MAKSAKTNAARILEKNKIDYSLLTYQTDNEHKSGEYIAKALNKDISLLFKTIVCQGASNNYYVFVLPSEKELNLKAAAAAVKEKNVELIPVKKLIEITGYVRGGCSPVGMKKQYKTVFDSTVLKYSKIIVSGGKIGFHIEVNPKDLINLSKAFVSDIIIHNS